MNYFYYNTDASSISEEPLLRFPVLINGGFAAVGGDREKFGVQLGHLAPNDLLLMYENGIGVVAIGRVLEYWDGVSHITPRYYSATELIGFEGDPHEYRISVEWFLDLSDSPIGIEQMRKRFGYKPKAAITRGAIDKIVKQRDSVAKLIEESQASMSLLPEEIARPSLYVEGATRRVSVNAYERSRKAVLECKAHKGTMCILCGFDFGAIYGDEFSGFIHVHHLQPLSEIEIEYEVNPLADLCPVCPNCHAVIHYGGRLRSLEEVKRLLEQQKLDKPTTTPSPVRN